MQRLDFRRIFGRTRCVIAPLVFGLLFANISSAVVITTGDGSGNTTAPDDDFGFANIGTRGVGSAIYLGNRWVLTASHVQAGTVVFDGVSYPNIVDQTFRLMNTDEDLSDTTDLILMRLVDDPGLPALKLSCTPMQIGSEVTMAGAGRDRSEERLFWTDSFEPTSPETATIEGYSTENSRTVRWGRNFVNLVNVSADSGSGDVWSFSTLFDEIIPTQDLAQSVRGDSGGAAFQKNFGVWELVGLIHAVDIDPKQPGGINSAVFGNESFIADLFTYKDQIMEIADFEPEPGDFDGDGSYTPSDLDALLAAIPDSTSHSCHFDLDGDSRVRQSDFDQLLMNARTLPGDTDLNGEVDFRDFLELAWAFGTEGAGWAGGDFDGDGLTSFTDFLTLANAFGNRFEPASKSIAAAAVPEPSSAYGYIVGILLLVGWHRARRRAKIR